jgi:hypothetical protein
MKKKQIIAVVFALYTVFAASCTDIEEQLKIFHKYDELMNIKPESEYLGVEQGSEEIEQGLVGAEIFSVEDISEEYRHDVEQYLNALTEIIQANLVDINNYAESFEEDNLNHIGAVFNNNTTINAYLKHIRITSLFKIS